MHTYASSWLFDLYDDHSSMASAASFEESTAAASSEEPDPMALPKTRGVELAMGDGTGQQDRIASGIFEYNYGKSPFFWIFMGRMVISYVSLPEANPKSLGTCGDTTNC